MSTQKLRVPVDLLRPEHSPVVLLDRLGPTHALTYGGYYNGTEATDIVGGETVHMGINDMRPADAWEPVTHLLVPMTTWGDYSGGTLERSNARALVAYYGESVFVTVSGGYGSEYLALPVHVAMPEGLAEVLVGLAHDYPLFDEEDHSTLEREIVDESWDAWVSHDLPSALASGATPIDIGSLEFDDDVLRVLFFEALQHEWETGNGEAYVCEDATSCYFPAWDRLVQQVRVVICADLAGDYDPAHPTLPGL